MKKGFFFILVFCCAVNVAHAEFALANPLEWAALAEGNELINGEVKSTTERQLQTAALQNAIAGEFTQIKSWEKKYYRYLTEVDGFASSVKAATTLYHDGVMALVTLNKLRKAIAGNPQGAIATMSMNNLYMETAQELVTVYNVLNDAVAKGGKENMLNGQQRSQTLWLLQDRLRAFGQKLRFLYMSVRFYTLADVWNGVTAGMIDRDHFMIARDAQRRWRRAAKSVQR
ncbi:MAG: hypothetical protein LUC85_03115 [Bacteroidales bacterium]|nr:hypothetical protein [Bacteroidales bacterium]